MTLLPPANLKCNETKSSQNLKQEVLHLFRWFTHTLGCRGAFLEDAQLGSNRSKCQRSGMIASNEEKGMIYVLLSSGISEDAARCWARTFPKIARCPARVGGAIMVQSFRTQR